MANDIARLSLSMTLGLVLALSPLSAQNQQSGQAQQKAGTTEAPAPAQPKPLELPNFIIEGVEQVNVASGVKQLPEKPARLNAKLLDSLNSIEKQQSPLLPIEPLPSRIVINDYKHGFLRGEYGMYGSPNIEGGMGFNLQGYELYANAGLDISKGPVTNADYNKFFANLSSDYIAPDKFWIFGGSRTRASVKINNSAYNLYKTDNPIKRNAFDLNLGADVEGNFEGSQFKTGAGFNVLSLTSKLKDATDNNLNGYLQIQNFIGEYLVSGNILLDFHSINGTSANFGQLDAALSYVHGDITLKGNGGFQFAGSSLGVNRGGLLLAGNAEYRVSKLYTLKAEISSGLARESMKKLYDENPYISFAANVDFPYDIVAMKGFVSYHPTQALGLTAGLRYSLTDRRPIFTPGDTGTFNVQYLKATEIGIEGEGFWNATENDKFILNTDISTSSLELNSNAVPNVPDLKLSADYARKWSESFGTHFGIVYYGERFADIENKKILDSFLNLKLSADYRLNKDFVFYVRFDNLLNSNVYIWDGYKERSLFGALGLMWQF